MTDAHDDDDAGCPIKLGAIWGPQISPKLLGSWVLGWFEKKIPHQIPYHNHITIIYSI